MSTPPYQWLTDGCQGTSTPRRGAVVMLDYNFNERGRLSFTGAFITELDFPALDRSLRQQVDFGLTLQPRTSRIENSAGSSARLVFSGAAARRLMSANFRLRLDQLPTTRVRSIEPLVLTRPLSAQGPRDPVVAMAPLKVSNFALQVAEIDVKDYDDWFNDFVIQGNSSNATERGGSLDLLAPDLHTVLFTIGLVKLGIVRVNRMRGASGAEVATAVRVEFYLEQVGFAPGAATAGVPAPPAAGGSVALPAARVLREATPLLAAKPCA